MYKWFNTQAEILTIISIVVLQHFKSHEEALNLQLIYNTLLAL